MGLTGEAVAFDFFGLWGSDDTPPPISKDAIPYAVTFQVEGDDKDVAGAAQDASTLTSCARTRPRTATPWPVAPPRISRR